VCGFIGALGTDLSRAQLAAAAELIAHRGPDGCEVAEGGPLCLVAYRLAIVPPAEASPVVQRGEETVVLNGELYDLPRASAIGPTTDTEQLATLLAERGVGVLPELRGLFAICRFDGRRLLLARDRFGIKPLYYARHRDGLVFASEIKALLALPGFSREPDADVLAAFDILGHNVFPGRTPFRRVSALRPGHALVTGDDAECQPYAFVTLPPVPGVGEGLRMAPGEAAESVEALLDAALRRAMRHDPQPKALFFSGGLDSSLLLDLARSWAPVTAHVLRDDERADDLLEARKVASALGVELREHRLTVAELDREIVHNAWHFEHPIAGGPFDILGGVAFHALARRVARETKVALCGEGADELFLGYHRLHVQPWGLLSDVAERARLGATPAVREWLWERGLGAPGPTAVRALRDLALKEGLSEYHLPSVDRSGMAFGLELRPPYLDEDLFDFAVRLDEGDLLDRAGRWTKLPLRAIARRRFTSLGLDRVAVRRKWAMPSAVRHVGGELAQNLTGTPDPAALGPLCRLLFHHLHVDPGHSQAPDLTLSQFAAVRGGAGSAR